MDPFVDVYDTDMNLLTRILVLHVLPCVRLFFLDNYHVGKDIRAQIHCHRRVQSAMECKSLRTFGLCVWSRSVPGCQERASRADILSEMPTFSEDTYSTSAYTERLAGMVLHRLS